MPWVLPQADPAFSAAVPSLPRTNTPHASCTALGVTLSTLSPKSHSTPLSKLLLRNPKECQWLYKNPHGVDTTRSYCSMADKGGQIQGSHLWGAVLGTAEQGCAATSALPFTLFNPRYTLHRVWALQVPKDKLRTRGICFSKTPKYKPVTSY